MLRCWNPTTPPKLPMHDLGMSEAIRDDFESLITRPHGIILVTGPTGAGKTTTLYAALNTIVSDQIKILTVEDPVEYVLPGVNQVQVNPKIGLNFSMALRAFLRHDPDVVLVGEIRDQETTPRSWPRGCSRGCGPPAGRSGRSGRGRSRAVRPPRRALGLAKRTECGPRPTSRPRSGETGG